MREDVGPSELRDLHNLFIKTLDAKLLAPSSIEGRFASLCSRCAEFTTVRLNVERISWLTFSAIRHLPRGPEERAKWVFSRKA
jgi:hypothetical protein